MNRHLKRLRAHYAMRPIFFRGTAICIVLMVGVPIAVRLGHGLEIRRVTQEHIVEGWRAAGVEIKEHRVRKKENFWRVAQNNKIDIDTIIGANPELKSLHAEFNQLIRVPNCKGVLHAVREKETAESLSGIYGISPEVICEINNITEKQVLEPALDVFIPGAKPVRLNRNMSAHFGLRGIFGSPVPGRITSVMGERKHPVGGFRGKHTGIDLAASAGTRIVAAAAGTVTNVGAGDYIGRFVILEHKDSYTTLYGHCSAILVKTGQMIKKGQVIAKVGATGRATGPHLHFEIRKNGIPQDPLSYLW